jgi:hypothetical protein
MGVTYLKIRPKIWKKIFSVLAGLINKLIPITYSKGIKCPCNPSEGKGDWRMIGNNGLQLSLPDHSTFNF